MRFRIFDKQEKKYVGESICDNVYLIAVDGKMYKHSRKTGLTTLCNPDLYEVEMATGLKEKTMEKTNKCSVQFIYMCCGLQYECKYNYNGDGACDYWADGRCACVEAIDEAIDTLKKSKWMEAQKEAVEDD